MNLNEIEKYIKEFEKECKSFEKEYAKKTYGADEAEWTPKHKVNKYYALDDHEIKMIEELAEKMNCTWEYVMMEAIDWYYMAVMEGVVENKKEEEITSEPDMVNRPHHYTTHNVETIEKIERFIDGLPSKESHLIGSALKYFDRAGLKDDFEQDCNKGNNYLHRAITGKWRYE